MLDIKIDFCLYKGRAAYAARPHFCEVTVRRGTCER